jgi:hypothetical protein
MYQPSKEISCSGKQRFESFKAAQNGIPRKSEARFTPYRCNICSMYHVGHSSRRERINYRNIVQSRDARKLIDY